MSGNFDPLGDQCGICCQIFVSKNALLRHLRTVHDIQPHIDKTSKSDSAGSFSCYICGQTFAQKWSVTRHLKNIHEFEIDDSPDEPQAFQCSLCPKSYQRKKDLNKHVRRKHLGETNKCELCGNVFTANESLLRHLQTVHLVDMVKIKVVNEDLESFRCQFCEKTYKNRKDLYHHNRLKHDMQPEEDIEDSTKKKGKVSCYICSGEFSTKYTLNRHLRKMHSEAPAPTTSGLCPLCDIGVKNGDNILAHLEEAHGVIVESEKLNFNTFEEFVQWRDKMYVDTMSQFAKARGVDKVKNGERMYLNCHHSGRYRGRGSGHRYRDPNSICKRGKVCPARLVVTCTLEGVEVVFYKTHVGHSKEPKCLRLTRSEREEIAGMLLNDVPHHKIIEKIRRKMPSSRERTIKLQDLYNIRRDFNIDDMKEIMRTHAKSFKISDEMVESVLENVWNVKPNNEDVYTVVLDSEIKCRGCRLLCWVTLQGLNTPQTRITRTIHLYTPCCKNQAGRYRITSKKDLPLTYEMANPPHQIAHRKAWNSWNTSNVDGGIRPAETAIEDVFIRKFMVGTWHGLFVSEVIIKRQHNIVRIAGIIRRGISARKMYFLLGYTEELLSFWLQCPVKLELQTVADKKDVVFKYI